MRFARRKSTNRTLRVSPIPVKSLCESKGISILGLTLAAIMSEATENKPEQASLFSDTIRRLRNRYRLVIINDDTYEEMVTFKLTRLSVYIAASSIFILLVGFTVALLVLTPLKYYIAPGYGSSKSRGEIQMLKMRTDSLEQSLRQKEKYLNEIRAVLSGNENILRDTNAIVVPTPEITND